MPDNRDVRNENEILYVTRPSLPPIETFMGLIEEVWRSRTLTNNGPLARRFEAALAERLGVEHLSLAANATVGAVVALRQLGVKGEVVTTPFSFVATANAIRFAGAEPVFADIDPVTLNIDPEQVARKITPRTSAIYAVHCYGTPCDVDGLAEIGARRGIPVIYDAAHAFGVRHRGESLMRHGDMSVLSFHATKVFHSAEGGAIICRDRETKLALDRLANHGITDETTIDVAGLNAKMSELHAAMGLAQLDQYEADVAARRAVGLRYEAALASVPGIRILCRSEDPDHNQYAFPILVEPPFPMPRDALQAFLRERGIMARRYFHPLIPHMGAYRATAVERFPVAEAASGRVLCLPLYPDLRPDQQMRIIEAILLAADAGLRRCAG